MGDLTDDVKRQMDCQEDQEIEYGDRQLRFQEDQEIKYGDRQLRFQEEEQAEDENIPSPARALQELISHCEKIVPMLGRSNWWLMLDVVESLNTAVTKAKKALK